MSRDPSRKNIAPVCLPSGVWRYRLRMMVAGQQRTAYFDTPELAATAREQWRRGGLPSGEAGEAPVPKVQTLEDALDLARLGGRDPHGIRSVTGGLRRHYPELLAVPVAALTVDHFLEFRKLRDAAGIKPNTIHVNMATLRAAIKRQRPDFKLPMRAFPATDDTRQKMLTATKLRELLLAIVEPQRTMAHLASVTFMREGELRTLRVDAVDLVGRFVRLQRAKAGPRVVKLSPLACEILRGQLARVGGSPYVFPSRKYGRPYTAQECWERFKAGARAVGLDDWTFHDLRHHCAMVALNNGASLPVLQAMGGWKRAAMVQRYAVATDETVRAELLALDRLHATRPRRGRAGA